MQRKIFFTTLVVLIALGFATGHRAANEPDQILLSFEREFSHVPSPAPETRRDSIDNDELYRIVNSVHWTRSDQDSTENEDTIAGGTDHDEQADD